MAQQQQQSVKGGKCMRRAAKNARTGKYAAQRKRTNANIIARRERHVKAHPRDRYAKDALMRKLREA